MSSPARLQGPYELLGPLAAGGMGEVHRARDTRLGREVAVKILPSQFAARSVSSEAFREGGRAPRRR